MKIEWNFIQRKSGDFHYLLPTRHPSEVLRERSCNSFDHTQSGGYAWCIAPLFQGTFPDQGQGCDPQFYRPGNYFLEDETEHIFSNAWNTWFYYSINLQDRRPVFASGSTGGEEEYCSQVSNDPCATSPGPWNEVKFYSDLQSARIAQINLVFQQDSIRAILDQGKTMQMVNLVEDVQITQAALVDSLMLHQPLSDEVIIAFTERDSLFSNTQVKMVLSPNLPLNDSLVQPVFEFINRRHKNIKDTLFSLHVFNESYTTIAALERQKRNEVYIEKESLYELESMYVDSLEFDKLLYLYRDTLANAPEYKINLLATYLAIDSVTSARSLLNQLALNENISEQFIEYYDLVIGMEEDTLTWLEIDSVSVLKLKEIAQSETDLSFYALAALELRGDTVIKMHPEEVISGPSGKYAQAPKENNNKKINSDIKIYPNPSKGFLNIESKEIEGDVIINFFDISGRIIYSDRLLLRKNSPSQVNVSNISNGLYFIQINKDGKFVNTSKIVFE
jgi:hypothetical protein